MIISFAFLSSNAIALAVTPSSIDFSEYDMASLVVFNTEDYVRDFSLDIFGSGFSVDKTSLRIPPRSKAYVNVSSYCDDCETRLYVRELSNSEGIKVEPAIIIKLSSGEPSEPDFYSFEEPNEVTSFSFIDVKKPEVLAFAILSSLLVISTLIFFGRKLYIKKFHRRGKSKKKKWFKKLF